MIAIDLNRKREEKKIAVSLSLIGDEGLELYNSFSLTDVESILNSIQDKSEAYCSSKKNIIFERYSSIVFFKKNTSSI